MKLNNNNIESNRLIKFNGKRSKKILINKNSNENSLENSPSDKLQINNDEINTNNNNNNLKDNVNNLKDYNLKDNNLKNKPKNEPDIVNNALLSLMILDGDDKTRNQVKIKPKFKHKFMRDINKSQIRTENDVKDNDIETPSKISKKLKTSSFKGTPTIKKKSLKSNSTSGSDSQNISILTSSEITNGSNNSIKQVSNVNDKSLNSDSLKSIEKSINSNQSKKDSIVSDKSDKSLKSIEEVLSNHSNNSINDQQEIVDTSNDNLQNKKNIDPTSIDTDINPNREPSPTPSRTPSASNSDNSYNSSLMDENETLDENMDENSPDEEVVVDECVDEDDCNNDMDEDKDEADNDNDNDDEDDELEESGEVDMTGWSQKQIANQWKEKYKKSLEINNKEREKEKELEKEDQDDDSRGVKGKNGKKKKKVQEEIEEEIESEDNIGQNDDFQKNIAVDRCELTEIKTEIQSETNKSIINNKHDLMFNNDLKTKQKDLSKQSSSSSTNKTNSIQLNKDSYCSNNSDGVFMDDDLCKSITTPSQRFSHRESGNGRESSSRLDRNDSSNSRTNLDSDNNTKSSGQESSSVIDQDNDNDEFYDERSITKMNNSDGGKTKTGRTVINDSDKSPITKSPMTKSPMTNKTTFSRASDTNTNLNTNDKYKKIYKITEENDLEDSDDFDDNRDVTATDVQKQVNAKCKGWDKLENDDDDILNSNTVTKKSSKKLEEQFEGELGSIINEEAFRSTKIGFKATNKREFDKFKQLEIDFKIGEGGEGEVQKSKPLNGEIFAIKIFKIDTTDEKLMNHKIKTIIDEFDMFKNINNKHLVNYLQLDVPDFTEDDKVEIKLIMNQIKGVSLSNLIKKLSSINKTLSHDKIKKITRGVLQALDYLHSKDIVHRDLKPSNIMIDEKFNAFLTDQGISKKVDEAESVTHTTVGTPLQIAPEVLRKKCVKKTDVQSFGCTLMEILTNKRPWAGMMLMGVRLDELVKKDQTPWHHFKKNNPDIKVDLNAEKVCEMSMRFDQNSRPNVLEILEMDYQK